MIILATMAQEIKRERGVLLGMIKNKESEYRINAQKEKIARMVKSAEDRRDYTRVSGKTIGEKVKEKKRGASRASWWQ